MQPVNGTSLRKNYWDKNSLISYLKWIICFPIKKLIKYYDIVTFQLHFLLFIYYIQ
jgi:hypothetical protein